MSEPIKTPRTYTAAAISFDRLMQESEQMETELATERNLRERAEAAIESERRVLRADNEAHVARCYKAEVDAAVMRQAIEAYRTAYEPDGHLKGTDCFATGPLTGDPIQDLVACPGCFARSKGDAALSNTAGAELLAERDSLRAEVESLRGECVLRTKEDGTIEIEKLTPICRISEPLVRDIVNDKNELAKLRAEVARLREDHRAIRNRLVSAMTELEPGEYEVRRAHAESKVNEFEAAFNQARKEQP